MKSAKTQSNKNVVRMHLRNTTTSNKTARIIHMPTREEAIRMFTTFLRNFNNLGKPSTMRDVLYFHFVDLRNKDYLYSFERKDPRLYWAFWDGVKDAKIFTSFFNVDKRDFTHDDLHLFDMLSDTWRG